MPQNPKIPWTAQQLDAITATGSSLLVSAAAGSGKTAVLASRCVHLVCDAPVPCDLDELLVVTFTEAAAAEMKSRIELALRERIDAGESAPDSRLMRQLALVERAQVGTLHGFCARLLRQHFHLLGLDPNFGILDAGESGLLRHEVVRDLFAARYEADAGGLFQSLVDNWCDGQDEALISQVISTHELLCSLADPAGWLATARGRLEEGADKPLRQTAVGRELAEYIKQKLVDLAERCTESLAVLRLMQGYERYAEYVAAIKATVDEWGRTFGDGAFDALAAQVNAFSLAAKPTIRNAPPGKAAADAAVEAARGELSNDQRDQPGSLMAITRFTAAQWSDGLRTTRPAADLFLSLVEEFADRYQKAKKEIRKVDFSDLEFFTLKILCGGNVKTLAPSNVARACHRQFKHVLVDEYQDINEVQDAILRLVSRECLGKNTADAPTNLFCVGDVKQSIYGFRLAEPARFLERARLFRGSQTASARSGGRVIDLQSNFRSRAPLLKSLNALFERLMTEQTADLRYDATHRLAPGLAYPDAGDSACFTGAPIELHVLPSKVPVASDVGMEDEEAQELNRTEREAGFIAHRIHDMMGHMDQPRMHVIRKNPATGQLEPQPIRFRDIVILLRSMRHKADQFTRILEKHQIRTHRESGTGYFASMEVRDMLALLHLLDNQRQDIPLAAVLRSPISGLAASEDSLARIVLAYQSAAQPVPFHEAVVRYAAEKQDELAAALRDFLNKLAEWRQLARQRPLADLIWQLYDLTGYLAFCSGLENGEQRVANLVYLHERARQFGSFARQGLYRFLKFLQSLQNESDLGEPSVLSDAEDVVRVMSIHRSKGLEFPVVFLPDLGKRINMISCHGSILVDRHAYLGLSVPDEQRQVRYGSLAWFLVQRRLRRQIMAEELRVLYVAATRAREHLVLVGTGGEKQVEQWTTLHAGRRGPLPTQTVLGASSMLDWIGPAAASLAGSAEPTFSVAMHTPEEVNDWLGTDAPAVRFSPRQENLARLKQFSKDPPPDAQADQVVRRLTRVYELAPFSRLAAAQSVTAWAKQGKPVPVGDDNDMPETTVSEQVLPLPRCMFQSSALSAADIGTATHVALEHLDFSRSCAGQDLSEQLEKMVQRQLIVPAQAAAVDRQAVAWFLGTELGRLVRSNAKTLRREIPFHLAVAPERFDQMPSSAAPADQVMLRGRIDLLVATHEGLIVVDYKTDRVVAGGVKERAAFYAPQVDLYREAMEKITAKKVTGVYLVFLAARVVWEA